ncbi:hypothetical protein DIPPA_05736 [Diplonema papillatum]|nr:hypothetical protein DIPPA_05736 [Diplonema papillatum]
MARLLLMLALLAVALTALAAECPAVKKICYDGSVAVPDPLKDCAADCPVTGDSPCSSDTKRCPDDGTIVHRSPILDCAFHQCPAVFPCIVGVDCSEE